MVGEPEFISRTECVNTEPLCEPGWLNGREGVEEVASEMVHEAVPHESPEEPPFPLAKLTANRKVTSPEPLEGAVQSTVHVLEFEFE